MSTPLISTVSAMQPVQTMPQFARATPLGSISTAQFPMRMPSITAPATVRTMGSVSISSIPPSISTMSAAPTTVMTTMSSGSQVGQVIQTGMVMAEPVMAVPQMMTAPMSAPLSISMSGGNMGGSMEMMLKEERAQRMALQAQMTGVLAELADCKARLDKLDPPMTPLKRETAVVEQRGNLRVNHESGHVHLLRPIGFMPRTTKEEPTAVFKDVAAAESICRDLTEVSNIFCCPMTIEGHTKGGESDFWQTLANRRASLVADKMIELGASADLLITRGLPGRQGKNEVRTEVFMDISNIKDIERAPVTEVDVIVGGRVVERDLVQAGRIVEKDSIKMAAAVEVDNIGGMMVAREVFTPVVERDLVGLGGKTVERSFSPPAYAQTIIRPATTTYLVPRNESTV